MKTLSSFIYELVSNKFFVVLLALNIFRSNFNFKIKRNYGNRFLICLCYNNTNIFFKTTQFSNLVICFPVYILKRIQGPTPPSPSFSIVFYHKLYLSELLFAVFYFLSFTAEFFHIVLDLSFASYFCHHTCLLTIFSQPFKSLIFRTRKDV